MNCVQLDPSDWRWKLVDSQLFPITTDLPPAPDDLLNIIRCKCIITLLLSENSLQCVAACANCHGDSCMNASPLQFSWESESHCFEADGDAEDFFYGDIDECDNEVIVADDDD